MAEQRNPILVLSELGRGNAYDQATKLWLLANDPDRSPVVSWEEIAAEQRKLELEDGL
jgi:hypothetical protein